MGSILVSKVIDMYTFVLIDAFIIISFVAIFLFINTRFSARHHIRDFVAGIFFMFAIVLVMSTPIVLENGGFFDGRAALLAITGAFYGPIPTVMTLVAGVAFRAIAFPTQDGIHIAIIVMALSSGIGLSWYYFVDKKLAKISSFYRYTILGLLVQIINFVSMMFYDNVHNEDLIALIFPFLVIFPLMTGLVGYITERRLKVSEYLVKFEKLSILTRAAVDASATIELYALDKDFKYIFFNKFHARQLKHFYNETAKEGANFLSLIKHDAVRLRLQETFNEVLEGQELVKTFEVEDTPGKFLRERYTPIRDGQDNIIGITIFSEEITELKRHEANITFLSYHDQLTKLKNRRYYYEEVEQLRGSEEEIIVVYFDINSLKIMNDVFGHDTGDKLLCKVSALILHHFSKHTDISRIGGDEIVALIKGLKLTEVEQIVEAFLADVALLKIEDITASVSVGIASAKSGKHLDRALLYAEEAMYQNKLKDSLRHRSDIVDSVFSRLNAAYPELRVNYEKVSELALKLGKKLGFSKYELQMLDKIALLRDLGKISIRRSILLKPAKLTEFEYGIVKKHPEVGYRMLSGTKLYSEIAHDILTHHEHFDGSGYPRGLKGEEIPIRARVILPVIAYVSITSERPYRKAATHEDAVRELTNQKGKMFDPVIIDALLNVLKS